VGTGGGGEAPDTSWLDLVPPEVAATTFGLVDENHTMADTTPTNPQTKMPTIGNTITDALDQSASRSFVICALVNVVERLVDQPPRGESVLAPGVGCDDAVERSSPPLGKVATTASGR
jgi:hypothetical protein